MGTHSSIGIKENGKVRYIYCHWDGYLSNNGVLLNLFYRNADKVRALINLGALSSLGYNVNAPRRFTDFNEVSNIHNYMNLHVKTSFCVSYHRDRGEKYSDVKAHIVSEKNYFKNSERYCYMFDTADNKWYLLTSVKKYQLDKLFSDEGYYNLFQEETDEYESFESIQNSIADYKYDILEVSVIQKYNMFLKEKGIYNLEFDYVKDKNGKQIYGLLYTKTNDRVRRKVHSRSACIGDLVSLIMRETGKSY